MTFGTSASSTPFRCAAIGRPRARLLVVLAVAVASAAVAAADAPLACRSVLPNPIDQLRWISPAESSDRLATWCRSVGPAVLRPVAHGESAIADDRFVVVSWNVHVGGGDVDTLIARLRRGEFTGGRKITSFVLLMQEAFRSGDEVPPVLPPGFTPPRRIAPQASARKREDVMTLALTHPEMAVFYVPSMRNGGIVRPVEDRGNAMLSTLPLEDPTAIELPLERQRRVAVAASVRGRTRDGRAWRLRLIDVHFDTALALLHGGPFAARRRQAAALVAAVADRETPTLLAGDLNTWGGSSEPALDILRRAFRFSDERPSAGGHTNRPTWQGPLGLHATLDHVFARGVRGLDVHRLDERFGSDHFPLLVEIRF